VLADGTLRKLEMHLTSLHLGEGLLTWTREDTIAFLEEKGPTGSGKKVADSRSNSCKKTALQRYVLACVTAHTWAQSVDQETMHDLKLLFNAIPCSTRSEVSAPHLLIGHVDDAEWCEAFVSLQQLYEPFARGHLTLVGYQLLDGLAAVRHHEGCKQHFQAQAAELKAKGIAIRLDNRYVHTREHICVHTHADMYTSLFISSAGLCMVLCGYILIMHGHITSYIVPCSIHAIPTASL
jgi:hypothetical protein